MDFSRWPGIPQQQQQHPTNPLHSNPSYGQLYNAPQHTLHPQSYTPFTYYTPNPNPNLSDPHTQFDSTGPDTGLQPPGVDPYAPNPYAPHAGYVGPGAAAAAPTYGPQPIQQQAASAYFHDPNAQHQNWGTTDPVGYAAAIVRPIGMEQMVGAVPNPMVWNNQRVHPYARGITMKKLKKIKVVQSAWCELCKIDCNSQEILNTHRMGKKHMKILRKLEEAKNVVANATVTTTEPEDPATVKEIPSGESAKGKKKMRKRISASKPDEDLETKRQKLMECGTTVDSLRVCTICNVVCNSETVFNLHLAGQKHAAKVASIPDEMKPMVCPNPIPVICNEQASPPSINGTKKKKKIKNKKAKVVQSVECELCKIDCSSQDVFNRHVLGRRHQRSLRKLEESKNAAAAAVTAAAAAAAVKRQNPAGTNESPAGKRAKTGGKKKKKKKKGASVFKPGEDLETKRRKLLECGTLADSVKVCEVCNVACNSEMVYKYHLAGQKHATLLKKQTATTAKSAFVPQAVTAATTTLDIHPQPVTALNVTSDVSPQSVTPVTASTAIGPQPVTAATATSAVSPQPVTAS